MVTDVAEQRPQDSAYFPVVFQPGPLGIVFHRPPSSDYVYVKDIIAGSQAAKSDVMINDRLWAVEDKIIGTKSVTKESWALYLTYIKENPRPLTLLFRRVLYVEPEEEKRLQALTTESTEQQPPTDIYTDSEDTEAAAVKRAYSSDLPGAVDNNAELILLNEIRVIASKIIVNAKSIELVTNAARFTNNGTGAGGIRDNAGKMAGNENMIMDFLCIPGRTLEGEGEVGVYKSTGVIAKPKPTASGAQGTAGNSAMNNIMSGITSIFGASVLNSPTIAMLTSRSPIGGRRYLHVFNDLILISVMEEFVPSTAGSAGSEPSVRYQLETIVDIPTCKLRRGEHSESDLLTSLCVPHFTNTVQPTLPQSGAFADYYGAEASNNAAAASNIGSAAEIASAGGSKITANGIPVYKNQLLELIHPAGVLFIVCKSVIARDRWCKVLFKCIMGCMVVQYGGTSNVSLPLGWHHQYILGTVHSAVMMRDDTRIEELLEQCEAEADAVVAASDTQAAVSNESATVSPDKFDIDLGLDLNMDLNNMGLSVNGDSGDGGGGGCVATVLEEEDVDGYTPLHYACILRQTSTIALLLSHFADAASQDHGVSVNIGAWSQTEGGQDGYESAVTCKRGWTPLHWAAVQLDFGSLELLSEHVYDRDLVLDHRGRNPLVLACLEGRNTHGQSDANSLAKCMSHLIDQHTDLNVLVPDASLQRREKDSPELVALALEQESADDVLSAPGVAAAGSEGVKINLLHVLASSWEHECCQILLKFKAKMNCIDGAYPCVGTRSQKYHPFHGYSPLHVAVCGINMKYALGEGSLVLTSLLQKRYTPSVLEMCARIRNGTGGGTITTTTSSGDADQVKPYITKSYLGNNVVDGPDMYENGLLTVEYLLLFGARPNLCTPVPCGPEGPEEGGNNTRGGTALELVVRHADKWMDSQLLADGKSSGDNYYMNKVITLLLSFGARLPSVPSNSNSNGNGNGKGNTNADSWLQQLSSFITPAEVQEACNVWANKPNLDAAECPELTIDSYAEYFRPSISIQQQQGVMGSRSASRSRSSCNTNPLNSPVGSSSGVDSSGNSGHKDESESESEQCQCCQVSYTMFRRAHTCRLCARSCCDDCSKKRITFANNTADNSSSGMPTKGNSTAHRICDGCFSRARHTIERAEREKRILNLKVINPYRQPGAAPVMGSSGISPVIPHAQTDVSSNSSSMTSDSMNRTTLFSGSTESNSNGNAGSGGIHATTAKLSETHQRLQDRGEKLNQVADKSSELASASQEFAKMARELKAQQSKSWF